MATIKGTRSPLFWRHIPGGLPAIVDVRKVSGNIYFVDGNADRARDSSGKGYHPDYPFATIDYAIGQCTANQGDVIYVLPGHTETVAAAGGITVDVAGVSIIGLGSGASRPRLTFGTLTGASVLITAANVQIANIIGVAGVDGLTNPFHVQAADCTLDIEWRDGSAAVEAARAILTTAAADRLKVNLVYRGFADGNAGVNAIHLVGVDGARIQVDYFGVCTTAVVEMETTQCTNIDVQGRFYVHGITDLSRNVVDSEGSSTWTVAGFDSPAGAHFSGGDAHAVAVDDVGEVLEKIGDPEINSVASDLASVLGDPGAGNSIESLVDDVQTEVDKIGDPEIDGAASTLGAVLGDPGAGKTIESLIDDVQTDVDSIDTRVRQLARHIKADVTAETAWSTGNSPVTLFTVTGDVLVRVFGTVQTGVASVSDDGTLAVGVDGATDVLLPTTTANGVNLVTGVVWVDATATTKGKAAPDAEWFVIAGGEDIILTVATNNMSAGAVTIYCEWIPLSADGNVVAA